MVPLAKATNPSDTKWYFRDQDVGLQNSTDLAGTGRGLFCLSATDCKAVYYDATNSSLKFIDCDDATCSTGTTTILDGDTGCAITNCSTTNDIGVYSSIYCPATDDCKIAYQDKSNTDLRFIDCDNATCSSGTSTAVDTNNVNGNMSLYCFSTSDCKISYREGGTNNRLKFAHCTNNTCSTSNIKVLDGTGCVLTGCTTTTDVGTRSSIDCVTTTDCKISYKDRANTALKFVDCDDTDCGTGTVTILDGEAGCVLTGCNADSPTAVDRGNNSSIQCPTSTGCLIAYDDNTTNDVLFAECTNSSACASGTIKVLDGNTGCTSNITGCSTSTSVGGHMSMRCLSASDCKIVYREVTNTNIDFIDCDLSSTICDSGTLKKLDGVASCTLTNCDTAAAVGLYNSIYCPSATDCKVIYYVVTAGTGKSDANFKFGDCGSATCDSGTTITLDGNKIVNATTGGATVTKVFGTANNDTYYLVSDVQYPTNDYVNGSLGTGTYTLHLQFTNNVTVGTLTWKYEVGYCTVASDCTTQTAHVTSANQTIDSTTTSPQDPTVVAGSSLSIPIPPKTNWLYVKLTVVTKATTGTITINQNNTSGNNADTYISIPALTVPEVLLFLLPVGLFAPRIITWYKKKRKAYIILRDKIT